MFFLLNKLLFNLYSQNVLKAILEKLKKDCNVLKIQIVCQIMIENLIKTQ